MGKFLIVMVLIGTGAWYFMKDSDVGSWAENQSAEMAAAQDARRETEMGRLAGGIQAAPPLDPRALDSLQAQADNHNQSVASLREEQERERERIERVNAEGERARQEMEERAAKIRAEQEEQRKREARIRSMDPRYGSSGW